MTALTSTRVGRTPEGDPLWLFQLATADGLEVDVLSWGATLVAARYPDRNGERGDMILGFDRVEDYVGPHPCLGATVGRYANRIAGGRLSIAGRTVQLATNEGEHHLHGGTRGFDRVNWVGDTIRHQGAPAVLLQHRSPDGDQGYPGNLHAAMIVSLEDPHTLRIDYRATCDAPTVVNLTNHAYFNLEDGGRSSALDHVLQLHASRFTPTDRRGIPTGELTDVAGTALDFTTPHTIGERMQQLHGHGPHGLHGGRDSYDHNLVIDHTGDDGADASAPALAAEVTAPRSGRRMKLSTTAPGLQLYAGSALGGQVGHGGTRYQPCHGICLEPQHFPDAPNHAGFPAAQLQPGETFERSVVLGFDVASL